MGISTGLFIPWQGEPVASLGRPNDSLSYFDWSFPLHEMDGTPNLYDTFLRLADGRDDEAWNEFVEIYQPLVFRLARGKGLFSERNVPVTVVPGDMPCEEIDALT